MHTGEGKAHPIVNSSNIVFLTKREGYAKLLAYSEVQVEWEIVQ